MGFPLLISHSNFRFFLFSWLLSIMIRLDIHAQSFSLSNLQNANVISTSIQFGPDNRLYVGERWGLVMAYTIQRNGPNDYIVTSSETITLIQNIPNHDDKGNLSGQKKREVTGIVVGGTVNTPILYVGSSDYRVGGGGEGGDLNLDTNSGIITRLTWKHTQPPSQTDFSTLSDDDLWDKVDIVRGLPRSEENHANNGMELVNVMGTNYLLVCSGGNTNAGMPSNNFAKITEYALATAILSIDLDAINTMPVQGSGNNKYIYNLPTVDDPTRPNMNGITDPNAPGYDGVDVNDPFGGNDGLNQAKLVTGGPVQIFSPGYRNTYDLVVTENKRVYVTDNGANGGWGGMPENEGPPVGGISNVTNNYNPSEPGSTSANPYNGQFVNNKDQLELVTGLGANTIDNYVWGSYYGGHPTPIRANPTGAGLYTHDHANGGNNGTTGGVFRTVNYDPNGTGEAADPTKALPADWPPVPPTLANAIEGDFQNPGVDDNALTLWPNNTNGIDEYTASNFNGAMQGNLIAARFNGFLHRVILNANGSLNQLVSNWSSPGGNPLDVTCQGDNDVFPGTIWVATFNNEIKILEPADYDGGGGIVCIQPGETGYDGTADYDQDGYTNDDEVDNSTNHCDAGIFPSDFDGDFISDLNDPDDDNDGIPDVDDPFQMGAPFDLPVVNELFSAQPDLGGYLGLGFTGLMNNNDPNDNYLNWLDKPDESDTDVDDILGGAIGAVTIQQTSGDALGSANNQEKGFQFGVNVDQSTGPFTVQSRMMPPFHNHTGSESQGIFIGTGDQDNYIKFVMNASGLEVLQETAGVPDASPIQQSISAPAEFLDLYFIIDPSNGQVQTKYSIDGGPITAVGNLFAQVAVLNSIQQTTQPLAVGLIGTSGGNPEFAANWDFFKVTDAHPFISQALPDLTKAPNDPDQQIDLDEYFDDDNGVANLTYTVAANTDNSVGTTINNNILTLSFPSTSATADITIRATDNDLLFVEQTFTVTVNGASAILYRINAGGPQIADIDGEIDWDEDTQANNSPFLANPGSNSVSAFTINNFDPSVNQTTTPPSIFLTERSDIKSDPAGEMEWSFPVTQAGDYQVRLYMGNGWSGTSAPGQRMFDIQIEGITVFSDVDLSGEFGHQVGGVKSYTVSVNDGAINIKFIHGVQNPLINGIEILSIGTSFPPISVDPIADQTHQEGEQVDLAVAASGGDPNENFTFSATGLPPDMDIEPTNGHIFGTIVMGASSGGSNNNGIYNVTITVTKPLSNPVNVNFVWTINGMTVNPGDIVYRVNAGGQLTNDPEKNWEEDQATSDSNAAGTAQTGTPSPYLHFTGVANQDKTFGANFTGTNNTAYPSSIFSTERYSSLTGTVNNMQWDFPVPNGSYIVNLLFAETWTGAQQPGIRVFDIEVENQLEEGFDIVATGGWNTPVIKTYNVNVNDGNLDINFIKDIQNPAIKGIEIIASDNNTPPDLWAFINNTNGHVPRHENSFVQAGNHFYLFGGREQSTKLEIYNYNTNTWSTGAFSPTILNHFQAIEYQGLIWVIGAFKDNNYPTEDPAENIYIYDPAANQWITGPTIPANRRRGSAGVVVYNNKFYIVAGNTNGHSALAEDGVTSAHVAWFDEYDPATNTWTTLPDAPRARDHFHAVVIGDKLYLASGRRSSHPTNTFAPTVPEVDVYNFTTGQWSTLPSASNLPTPRAGASVVNFKNEVVVIGGESNAQSQAHATVEALNVNTNNWQTLASLNQGRHGTQAIVSGDGIHITSGSPVKGGGKITDLNKQMEVYSTDNPTGNPIDQSVLNAPQNVSFGASTNAVINISNADGDQGIFIRSFALTGTNAAEFSIANGDLSDFLLPAESVHQLEVAFNPSSSGQKTAVLQVNYGANGTLTINLEAGGSNGTPPVANAGADQTLTDTDGNGSEAVTLDGSASSDSDGTITAYAWSENGNPIATGVNPKVDLGVGTHTITLTVTDDENATDTDQVIITINSGTGNNQPVANAGADQTLTDTDGNGSEAVTLDGSASSDSDGSITSYAWSENGNPITTGVNPKVNLGVGTHTITLTVTDDDNATDTDEVVIIVNEQPQGDQVVSFTLIDATTDQPIPAFDPIPDGALLNKTTLPNNLNIRANTNPSIVGSVVFNLSGTMAHNRTESGAPYALFGDVNGNYSNWNPLLGSYILTATPYTQSGGKGNAGTPLTINFSVVNSTESKIDNESEEGNVITGSTPSVNTEETGIKLAYPNPIEDILYIKWVGTKGKINVHLIDPLGRTIFQETLFVKESDDVISIDLSHINIDPGIVFLRIDSEGKTGKMIKLIKTMN